MRMVIVARCFGLLLGMWTASGCSDSASALPDAAVRASIEVDAAVSTENVPKDGAEAAFDLHFLLIATVIEVERSLIARCPCLTEDGQYDSVAECVKAVSLGRDWVDCANEIDLSGLDDSAVRANLRCNIEELTQRTDCLMGSSCNADAIAGCMSLNLACPMLPLDVLSRVTVECRIALSR